MQTVELIPWRVIYPSPLNPRKAADRAGLEELASSISRGRCARAWC